MGRRCVGKSAYRVIFGVFGSLSSLSRVRCCCCAAVVVAGCWGPPRRATFFSSWLLLLDHSSSSPSSSSTSIHQGPQVIPASQERLHPGGQPQLLPGAAVMSSSVEDVFESWEEMEESGVSECGSDTAKDICTVVRARALVNLQKVGLDFHRSLACLAEWSRARF